jgi:hypothetical protein
MDMRRRMIIGVDRHADSSDRQYGRHARSYRKPNRESRFLWRRTRRSGNSRYAFISYRKIRAEFNPLLQWQQLWGHTSFWRCSVVWRFPAPNGANHPRDIQAVGPRLTPPERASAWPSAVARRSPAIALATPCISQVCSEA